MRGAEGIVAMGMGRLTAVVVLGAVLAVTGTASAQVRTIDPNRAGSLAASPTRGESPPSDDVPPGDVSADEPPPPPARAEQPAQPPGTAPPPPASGAERAARDAAANSYKQQDVLTAADGVFGKGASGLGRLLEKIFREQGRPTAYIAGHEAGGAFIVGVRYGAGTLFHKVEGQRRVNWTGPSVGLDIGGSASTVFVLVYNLYDSQELYHRFPAIEGQVYAIGGFTASYLRYKDTVLIPIRLGVGWRLGANVGYMNFTSKMRLLPF